jgi:thiosulfate/3-mercaptopyruvate sulfurtransferase
MPYETLIDTETLERHLHDPDWTIVDCRFSLGDATRGRADYEAAHVPGAVYAHLDDDLSGPVEPGRTGRHPLPDPAALATTLGRLGIGSGVQVVAYDDARGGIAVRLWWLLGWLGHDAVAVLDGGWPRWIAEGRPTRSGAETRHERGFDPRPRPERIASVDDVMAAGASPHRVLVDARAGERYRGEHEPIDPVAGHIPGAVSVPWAGNVDEEGRFLKPAQLRSRYADIARSGTEDVICYCGSGVTANHDILAMVHAGLPRPRLYPGSWSEWLTDPTRGRETGP